MSTIMQRPLSESDKVKIAFLLVNDTYPLLAIKVLYKVTDEDISEIIQEVYNHDNKILVFKTKKTQTKEKHFKPHNDDNLLDPA